MTTTPSTALVSVAPVFTNTERLALAGFPAGYSGLTRQAYELDLRQYASWCHQHHLRLFQARRADIERRAGERTGELDVGDGDAVGGARADQERARGQQREDVDAVHASHAPSSRAVRPRASAR